MEPSEKPHTLHLCYNIEVDLSDGTFGHVLSDVVVCVFDLILMFIAVVANFLTIAAYKRTVVLQTPSNYLLTILSVVDILLACTAQPLFLVWKILELAGSFSCAFYIATLLSINLLGAVSFLITSFFISLERYYAVFHPLVHRNNASTPFFTVAVSVAFFAWLLFLLGTFLGNFHRIYLTVAVTLVILCLLSTAVAYVRIFQDISSRCNITREISIESISDHVGECSREKKSLVNMVFIIGAMTLLYAPVGGCIVYAMLIGRDWLYMNYFVPWAYLLVFTSAAVNPFLYDGWKSSEMRPSIKGAIRSAFEQTDV